MTNPESRITNHESRISNLESRMTNLESRISNDESRITNHESRITNHESRITNHESRITNRQTRYRPSRAVSTALRSDSDRVPVRSRSDSLSASISARITCARLIATPLAARISAPSRSRKTICRSNR